MTAQNPSIVAETPYIWRARRPDRSHRLVCFPHAGASAGAYAPWVALLPPEVELVSVQLPGRMNRIAEPCATDRASLVRTLALALRPVLDGPFSFYGHSGGALMAFEVARALRDRGGSQPRHLFLSGHPAPDAVDRVPQLHGLSDPELAAEVVALGGIEQDIAEDAYMMGALLPTLRADFALCEKQSVEPGSPLDVPLTVLTGDADPRAPHDTLDGWRAYTTAEFRVRTYPGGHFYFLDHAAEVTRSMSRTMLDPTLAGRPS